jgi:hypothetical protein
VTTEPQRPAPAPVALVHPRVLVTTSRPVVRLATFEDAEPIADLLADAFLDYEWSRWAIPADNRRERLRGLHLLYAGLVGAEAGSSTWVTDDISSVAGWVKPGATPISDVLRTRLNEESAALFGDRLEAVDALDAETGPLRPAGPTGTSRPSARDRIAGARAWPRLSSPPAWPPATRLASRRRSKPRTRRTAACTRAWASRPPATESRLTAGCGSGSWSGRCKAEQRPRPVRQSRWCAARERRSSVRVAAWLPPTTSKTPGRARNGWFATLLWVT